MTQKNNLSVIIRTRANFTEQIQEDLKNLQSTIQFLPGNLDVIFESSLELRRQDTPATYFGKEREQGLPAVCEFPDGHFNEPQNLRNIILLHELIHAHQRQTILKNWDTLTMNKLKEYNTFGQLGLLMAQSHIQDTLKQNHDAMIKLIQEFYKIIFEAWNHLEMKNDFPQFFEEELINVHTRISNGTKTDIFDDWREDHMFHMFANLLEATFFAKITDRLQISFDYIKLGGFWRSQLRRVCTLEQFQKLLSVVNTMTNTSQFPNSDVLEQQYDGFCQLLIDRKVFENH